MLDSLHIKNFRCFEDLTIPSLGRVNLIVGKNNCGKSTLLEAVKLFADSGNNDSIRTLLKNRGDASLFPQKKINGIFFKEKTPDSIETSLEVSDIKKHNVFLIFNTSVDFNSIKKYIDNQNIDKPISMPDKFFPYSLNKLIVRDEKKDSRAIPAHYSPTHLLSENFLADIWDTVFLTMNDSIIQESLKIIEKDITNIAFVATEIENNNFDTPTKERIAVVKLRGQSSAVPVRRLGDGVMRLLQIFLSALLSKDGFLLIDEFENGLHYSIQEKVWGKIFELAKETNIQVFATTHSEDTVKAFCKVALDSEEEGRLIALGRSPVPEDNGRIVAVSYDEKEIAVISRTGMEVR